MSATGPAIRAAVRVINQNSCGSGSICGRANGGIYIITNAHVAGNRIGREVKFDCVVNGQSKRLSARVVMAAYNDRTQTDWAVLFCEEDPGIEPVKLSIERPRGSHYTHGSPRCVWPQVGTDITTVDMADNMPLWRWRPNSIGGQSGSGVWSDNDNLQYGLLTWSWGGYGAGQMTAEIYRQALNQTTVGYPRIPGMIEVDLESHGDSIDGLDEPTVSAGFFAESSFTELPIWHKPGAPPVAPPPTDPTELQKLVAELFGELDDWQAKWRAKLGIGEDATAPGVPPPFDGLDDTFGL